MNILIVDDEPKIRNGLKNLINGMSKVYTVMVAEDGIQALELVKENYFDLIFTDIKMPSMDGLEFIKNLKKINPRTVVVVISGYADFYYAQQAIKFNIYEYILKPIDPKKIRNILLKTQNRVNAVKASCLQNQIIKQQNEKETQHPNIGKILDIKKYYVIFEITFLQEVYEENKFAERFKELQNVLYKARDEKGVTVVVFSYNEIVIGIISSEQSEAIREFQEMIEKEGLYIKIMLFSEVHTEFSFLSLKYKDMLLQAKNLQSMEYPSECGNIVKIVIDYINMHYTEVIQLKTLAELVYIHPTYLSKLFKKETNQNLFDYITLYRIEKAKELLKDPKYKIYKVAEETGFKDAKYFTCVFKAKTGETPNEYRNKH